MTPARFTGVGLLLTSLLVPGLAIANPHPLSPDEAFGDITRIETSTRSESEIKVDKDGTVFYQLRGFFPGASQPPVVNGTATPAELDALGQAIANARFYEIPRDIGLSNPPMGATKSFFRVITDGMPDHDRKIYATKGLGGQYKARLDAVDAILDAIGHRLLNGPAPSGRNFNLVQLETTRYGFGGLPINRTVSVLANGEVEIRAAHPLTDMGPTIPVTGTATDAELTALEDAVKLANMETMPDPLPPVMTLLYLPADNSSFLLTVKSDDDRHVGQTRGKLNGFGAYSARLRPLVDLAEKIGNRILALEPIASTRNFTLAQLETDTFGGIGARPTQRTVAVLANGEVSVRTVHPLLDMGPPAPALTGTATDAELTELEDAVKLANMETIPDPLPPVFGPMHSLVPRDSFLLTVKSDDDRHVGMTRGFLRSFGQYSARLRPLVSLLERIGNRINAANPPAPTPTAVTGTIDVQGFWGFRSVHLIDGNTDTEIKPWSLARKLLKFEGEKATVLGLVENDVVTATEILSPKRQDLSGPIVMVGGEPKIEIPVFHTMSSHDPSFRPFPGPGMPSPFPPMRNYADTFGPAAKVLTKADNAFTTVDAWVFNDEFGRPAKAYVLSVKGSADPGAIFRRSGSSPEALTAGQVMRLLKISRSGKSFKVRLADGRKGYVKVDTVGMGPVPFHRAAPPVAQPSGDAAGLVGGLGN